MTGWTDRVGDWYALMPDLFDSPGLDKLLDVLNTEHEMFHVYPKRSETFRAFKLTPFSKTRLIFLGLCPYHTQYKGIPYADGLAFSCSKTSAAHGIHYAAAPSLKKMIDQYDKEFPQAFDTHLLSGDLSHWAEQGILLLNSALTVRQGLAKSHNDLWKPFTRGFFRRLAQKRLYDHIPEEHPDNNIMVVAFGNDAARILEEENYPWWFKVEHPAAAARGNRPWNTVPSGKFFKYVNERLREKSIREIEW